MSTDSLRAVRRYAHAHALQHANPVNYCHGIYTIRCSMLVVPIMYPRKGERKTTSVERPPFLLVDDTCRVTDKPPAPAELGCRTLSIGHMAENMSRVALLLITIWGASNMTKVVPTSGRFSIIRPWSMSGLGPPASNWEEKSQVYLLSSLSMTEISWA